MQHQKNRSARPVPDLLPILAGVLACGVVLAYPRTAMGAEANSVFSGDTRLEARQRVSELDRPLGTWLPELGRKLGLRLTLTPATASERITLLAGEKPVRESLELVAAHTGFTWQRTHSGYELRQPEAERRREQEQRDWDLSDLRARITALRPWLQVAPEALAAERALRETQRSLDIPEAQHEAARLSREAIDQVLHHREPAGFTLRLGDTLAVSDWKQLFHDGELQLSGRAGTLPPALESELYAVVRRTWGITTTAPAMQRQTRLILSLLSTGSDPGDSFGPPVRRDRRLRLRVRLRSEVPDGEHGAFDFAWLVPRPNPAAALPPPARYAPELRRRIDLDLPAAASNRVAWHPSGATGHPAALGAAGVLWPSWPTVGQVGERLHRESGLPLVADAFTPLRIDPNLLVGQRPVGEILDVLAQELDLSWSYSGGVIRLRSRRRYLDRHEEAPERLLAPWKARVLRQGRLTLDDLTSLVLGLSGPQVRSLEEHWGWYFAGSGLASPGWLYAYRPHLRFWSMLSPAQRARVLAGNRLRLEEMTPPQRTAWWIASDAPPVTRDTYVPFQGRRRDVPPGSCAFSFETGAFRQRLFVTSGPDGPSGITRTSPVSSAGMLEGPQGSEPRGGELRLDAYTLNYHSGPVPPDNDTTRSIRIFVPCQLTQPSR